MVSETIGRNAFECQVEEALKLSQDTQTAAHISCKYATRGQLVSSNASAST